MNVLLLPILVYLMLWPLELLVALGFGIVAVRALEKREGGWKIRKRKQFGVCLAAATLCGLPALSYTANIELNEMLPGKVFVSPDGRSEVEFAFWCTTRSLDFIDPGGRLHAQLRDRATSRVEGTVKISVHEFSDFEQLRLTWSPDRVTVNGYRETFEIPRRR